MPIACRFFVALLFCANVPLWAQEDASPLQFSTDINLDEQTPPQHHSVNPTALPQGQPILGRPSRIIEEKLQSVDRRQRPTYLESDQSSGRTDLETTLEGQVQLRRGDTLIRADRIDYYLPDDQLKARGNVYINRGGDVYRGPILDLKVDSFEGFFTNPDFQLNKNDGHGSAERMEFVNDKQSVAHKAFYTTCLRKTGLSWLPDWFVKAEKISLDMDKNEGYATDASIRFKGLPVVPMPDFGFPINNERRSGLLSPDYVFDSVSGFTIKAPYYWNIAPNRDLTVDTFYGAKRGLQFNSELRYLESLVPPNQGQLRFEYMPSDKLREDQRRWGYSHQHTGFVDLNGSRYALMINHNRVSDDQYWTDFSSNTTKLNSRLLPLDTGLGWGRNLFGLNVAMTARSSIYQVIQDPTNRITPPYNIVPSWNATAIKNNFGGFDWQGVTELTRFKSAREFECETNSIYCQPNVLRGLTRQQLSYPIIRPYGYVVPKLIYQARTYQFENDSLVIPNSSIYYGLNNANVTVPTVSLDAGLTFERSMSLFNRNYTQTLEPRVFYVKTPYRAQSYLPNYDSGVVDFNFATLFTENEYGGNDRVSATHMLTMGATSRLIDPTTGAEAARFGLAQRVRLSEQNVGIYPTDIPPENKLSDILMGATLNLTQKWKVDSTVQYNPETHSSSRASFGARFNPSNYRTISTSLRHQRSSPTDATRIIDTAWQWPISDLWADWGNDLGPGRGLGEDRWYSVARVNYNMTESRVMDTLMGFEYDAGCWLGRVVLERSRITTTSAVSRIMFQMEFAGFSRVGVSPFSELKNNIPKYQMLRDITNEQPSRFGRYE